MNNSKPPDTMSTTTPTVAKPKMKRLHLMCSAEDLDVLRVVFETFPDDANEKRLFQRAMRAVHQCRKAHGFKWVH